MKVEIRYRGEIIHRSKNLRGILDHARRYRLSGIHTLQQKDKTLFVVFADGATCRTQFADPTVLRDWIDGRCKRGMFVRASP